MMEQAIGILIRAALPWAVRIAEVNIDIRCQGKALVLGQLCAAILCSNQPNQTVAPVITGYLVPITKCGLPGRTPSRPYDVSSCL